MQNLKFISNGNIYTLGSKPLIMGVINVTPDSFSDGGRFFKTESAVEQGLRLVSEGADFLDIGGESSRPGAEEISVEDEKNRVLPVLQELTAQTGIPISVDTRKPEVARAAIDNGAAVVNDITGMRDREMEKILQETEVGFVMMHMRGTPKDMQTKTDYQELIPELIEYFQTQLEKACAAGIDPNRIVVDPGIGFSKTVEQNLEILASLAHIRRTLQRPILIGTSRKSFIAKILNDDDSERRRWGTAGSVAAAVLNGADILRVHDVREMRDAAMIANAVSTGA